MVLVRLRFEWKTYGIYDAPNGLRMILRLINQEKIAIRGQLKISPDKESLSIIKRRQEILGQDEDRTDNTVPEAWKELRKGQMERQKLPFIVKMDIFAFVFFNLAYFVFNYFYWNVLYK